MEEEDVSFQPTMCDRSLYQRSPSEAKHVCPPTPADLAEWLKGQECPSEVAKTVVEVYNAVLLSSRKKASHPRGRPLTKQGGLDRAGRLALHLLRGQLGRHSKRIGVSFRTLLPIWQRAPWSMPIVRGDWDVNQAWVLSPRGCALNRLRVGVLAEQWSAAPAVLLDLVRSYMCEEPTSIHIDALNYGVLSSCCRA